ncbi:MAG: NAD(P)-binding domain-containing protein [Nocardioidaceae bacterium]|nr:MAG: NAD(P)-binding domain-containing protein [Nocardioidaceae bacterium]
MTEQPNSPVIRSGATKTFDEAMVRRATADCDFNAIRLALYQLTGDQRLLKMTVGKLPLKGGAQFRYIVESDADRELLYQLLVGYLRDPQPAPSAPSRETAYDLMRNFCADDVLPESLLAFGYEQLAFEEFPRDAKWSAGSLARPDDHFTVAIIGAGLNGIAMAMQLKRLGIRHTVYERHSGVGGTWLVNHYPEVRVDLSAFIYQYSFEKNYPWSEYFPTRDETLRYLEHIVTKYGIRDDIRLECEVTDARWDEATARWHFTVRDADGTLTSQSANILISASGLFSTPNVPDVLGVEEFQGAMFHTTQWDHSLDLSGKRVALVGTGSTGTQLMAWVAERAEHLTIFQRNPQWISQTPNYKAKISAEERYLLDTVPYYWNWRCFAAHMTFQQQEALHEADPEWQSTGGGISRRNDALRETLVKYIDGKIGPNPELRAKVLPDYPPMVRRMVTDNGWYDALLRPNVELVNAAVERFTPDGIVSSDGESREFDVVILAAGFQVSKYFWPVQYTGREGATLEELWDEDGARAYLALAIPGFPNFFSMYGPNGQPRSGSLYAWAEAWARYIGLAIVDLVESGQASIEVRREVFDRYNQELDEVMSSLIFTMPGRSYYVNEHGRVGVEVALPADQYHARIVRPNPDDFELRGALAEVDQGLASRL